VIGRCLFDRVGIRIAAVRWLNARGRATAMFSISRETGTNPLWWVLVDASAWWLIGPPYCCCGGGEGDTSGCGAFGVEVGQ